MHRLLLPSSVSLLATGIQPSSIGQTDLQPLDRDVLIEAILRDPAVTCKIEGRIVNLTPSTSEENRQ
ncbi:MAG TPA: hypothetical protein VFG32_01820 [Bacteroidota bacterium]|nr:hypothetical protein [Bacteroidota bacterium]